MKVQYIYGDEVREKVLEIFKNIHDLVVPSMGAKSLYAVIDDPMGQPVITDDGVTIAKSIGNMSGYHKLVAKSMIEAAHNTEKEAYDGTTLTILLTYEIFKLGCELIEDGLHPQEVSDMLKEVFDTVNDDIEVMQMTADHVKDLATISTKIPALGAAVEAAFKKTGPGMEVAIEHKPNNKEKLKLVHSEGMSLRSGYSIQELADNVTEAPVARLALLKEENLNQIELQRFFGSIPVEDKEIPIIYVTTTKVNPEVMRIIVDTSVNQGLPFNFLWIEEALVDEVFMDLSIISGGKIRSHRYGVKEYTYEMCGTVTDLVLDIDKCTMNGINKAEKRIEYYEKTLEDPDRKMDDMTKFLIEQRLASLKNGVVKIQIGAATRLEYSTIRLKLDDAIGAVRKAFRDGIVLGGGKALYNLAGANKYELIREILREPHRRILTNAGLTEKKYRTKREGVDVTTGLKVDLIDAGIIDSYTSVYQSIKNATSIATNYLRAYTLIKEKE